MALSADALKSSDAHPESASSEEPEAAAAAAVAMPWWDLAFRSPLWFVCLKCCGSEGEFGCVVSIHLWLGRCGSVCAPDHGRERAGGREYISA